MFTIDPVKIQSRGMSHLGTQNRYPQRVPKPRYSPPSDDIAQEVDRAVALHRQQQEIEAAYKECLAKLTNREGPYKVPIAYMAERLGVERKTVYRHLGRSMT